MERPGIGDVGIGTELNHTYMIDSLIGVGGMGEVFRGHNIQTGDPVAIKVVLPQYSRDETILELFRKEARILNHLSHDAIVRYHVFTIDRSVGRPYLAMEYAGGPSLAERLKDGAMPERDVAHLQSRLADGLLKAHEAGVIHRDISPDNVILPEGQVKSAKIIDFGIARSANVGGATLLGGSFAGKYNWVSPEQLGLYGGEVTAQSDIYSLGLVLAAALRGSPIDMFGTQFDILDKRRRLPDLSGIPPKFMSLLSAMLEPDPARRIKSMAEVRDRSPGGAEPRTRPPDDATILVRPAAGSPKPGEEPPRAARRDAATTPEITVTPPEARRSGAPRRLTIAAASLAVIALAAAGGFFYFAPGQSKQAASAVSTLPAANGELAGELNSLIVAYSSAGCSFAELTSLQADSADLVAFGGNAGQIDELRAAIQSKAGFAPNLSSHIVSEKQCPVIDGAAGLSSPGAAPLKLVMANNGRSAASAGNGKGLLEADIADAGLRNVSILIVSDDGSIQNVNRICPKCLSLSGDTLKVRLPLVAPAGNASQQAQRPLLLMAIASPRNLFSISSQSIFNSLDLIPELRKEVASTPDVATALGYFNF